MKGINSDFWPGNLKTAAPKGCFKPWVFMVILHSLLKETPNPSKQQIEDSFDGNICRCTGKPLSIFTKLNWQYTVTAKAPK